MADYIPITEAQSDPEAPVDSSLIKRLRDNPLAIAEGSPGAPSVLGGAIAYKLIASGNLPTGGQSAEITNLEPHIGISVRFTGVSRPGSVNDFGDFAVSTNNGASYSIVASRPLAFSRGITGTHYHLVLNQGHIRTRISTFFEDDLNLDVRYDAFSTVSDPYNAIRLRFSASENTFSGGSFEIYGLVGSHEQ